MIYVCEEKKLVESEFNRLGFDSDGRWRISDINKDFGLCNTYPRFLIVPASFRDEDLESVARHRYFRRIPVAVWRHIKNGCFIARSSQPTVGWFWFRSEMDEQLIQHFVFDTVNSKAPNHVNNNNNDNDHDKSIKSPVNLQPTPQSQHPNLPQQLDQQEQQHLSTQAIDDKNESTIIATTNDTVTTTDTSAITTTTTTTTTHTDFHNSNSDNSNEDQNNLGNNKIETDTTNDDSDDSSLSSRLLIIDARSYTAAMANRAKGGGCEYSEYYQRCEIKFMDLANIHSIRKSFQAIRGVCEAYTEQSNNDGWDRTPQLVALAEIMLDPYYRTFEGFKILVGREWLDFGHKFADRCGSNPCNADSNERCPVFLQWLDCVQQMLIQFPTHFEFNSSYLDKLNRHTYSNVFGTFSHNSTQERLKSRIDERLPSLWDYFDIAKKRFTNDKYSPKGDIIRPSAEIRDLHFWLDVYKVYQCPVERLYSETI